jgi:hypothetical protein
MKLVAEYLADAVKFERLAAEEKNEDLKLSLLQQAAAYRTLAEKRAKELGKPLDQPGTETRPSSRSSPFTIF